MKCPARWTKVSKNVKKWQKWKNSLKNFLRYKGIIKKYENLSFCKKHKFEMIFFSKKYYNFFQHTFMLWNYVLEGMWFII